MAQILGLGRLFDSPWITRTNNGDRVEAILHACYSLDEPTPLEQLI